MKIKLNLMVALLLTSLMGQGNAHEEQQAQIEELTKSLNKITQHLSNEIEVDKVRSQFDSLIGSWLTVISAHIDFLKYHRHYQLETPCTPRKIFDVLHSEANERAKRTRERWADLKGKETRPHTTFEEGAFDIYRQKLDVCEE